MKPSEQNANLNKIDKRNKFIENLIRSPKSPSVNKHSVGMFQLAKSHQKRVSMNNQERYAGINFYSQVVDLKQ